MGFGFTLWIFCGVRNFCEVMVVDDGGLMVVGGWVGGLIGVGDFGFVLGL